MKLHFEPDLDYQKLAIESVADLFRGQEINRTEFTVTRRPMVDRAGQPNLDLGGFLGVQGELGLVESELGIGNRLTLLDDEIIANLKDIQLRNGLAPSTVRIPTIATTHSGRSRPPVPIDRDQCGAGARSAAGCSR